MDVVGPKDAPSTGKDPLPVSKVNGLHHEAASLIRNRRYLPEMGGERWWARDPRLPMEERRHKHPLHPRKLAAEIGGFHSPKKPPANPGHETEPMYQPKKNSTFYFSKDIFIVLNLRL